jgi:tRNA (guanine37-N1)-methyltransferase
MKIDIITIFPEACRPILESSILKRAQEKKKVRIGVHDLREYSADKHKKVDDRPFGGGPGMVLTAQPLYDAVKKIRGRRKARVILTCPTGERFTQKKARKLANERNLIFICGHYEGIDERIRDLVVDESLSIGDYILTGGELPALVMTDSIVRLIPGVLGKAESLEQESFENGLLEYPHYTRPANFRGISVPDVLLSGNHNAIKLWQNEQARSRTKKYRPDLRKDL